MKVSKILASLVIGTLLVIFVDGIYDAFCRFTFGKSRYASEAIYRMPDGEGEISIERQQTHLFLGEFDRTLNIKNTSRERKGVEITPDTGGYGRINLYKSSNASFILATQFSAYSISMQNLDVIELASIAGLLTESVYLGCFDRDKYGWRFIPISERAEQKMIFLTE